MADSKDDEGREQRGKDAAAGGRRAPGTQAAADPSPGGAPPQDGGGTPQSTVNTREIQYLIGPRVVPGTLQPMMAPASVSNLLDKLKEEPGYRELDRLRPRSVGLFSTGAGSAEVAIAQVSPELGEKLEAASQIPSAPFVAERNRLLNHHGLQPAFAGAGGSAAVASAALPGTFHLGQISVDFLILGADGQPLEKAQVELTGKTFQGKATTGKDGRATVVLFGEAPNTIMSLYVKPWADHWESFVERPSLSIPGLNTVALQPLSATFPDFPGRQMLGWGQELMGLHQIPAHLNGQGVKIAIIDSGCDNTHPLLKHIKHGLDLNNRADTSTWTQDEIAHGTHCAGVIAGAATAGQGIRGFAPGAEVHIFKVFPDGRFDTLMRALDLCIERQIDVVNCSLGSDQPNTFVRNKLEEARQNGVACVVATGNSAREVQFPANLPSVLSVAALGQQQRFPTGTQHARNVLTELIGLNGVFPARFSCFGPEVRLSGPGVAVVSTVPGGGYAAWDGTSMAAPHITGLAALVLAHHPAFQQALRARSAARVDSLFQLLVAACAPVVADPMRAGAGLPQAVRVLGTAPAASTTPAVGTAPVAAAPAPAAPPATAAGNLLGGFAGPAGGAVPAQFGQSPADAALLQALAPALAGLAGGGVPAGGLLGALLGQTLANGGAGFGAPPLGGFPGGGGYAVPPAYGMGAGGVPPHVLMQLRSLGLV